MGGPPLPFVDMPPAAVQPCDPAAHAAAIDNLEDQAFAAMKAATEKVAEASRRGAVGAAGDAEWASYKSLRAQAEQLRAQPGGCPSQVAAAPVAAPVAARPVIAQAEAPAALATEAAPPVRRFRAELSVFEADRQPSSASRLSMRTVNGQVMQNNFTRTPVPLPPPTTPPTFPPIVPNQGFQLLSVGPVQEGARPSVRSWSSGAALSMDFAPAGLGAEGWRWTASLEGLTEETRSDMAPGGGYTYTPGTPQYRCFLSGTFTVVYSCGYELTTGVTSNQYILPTQSNNSGPGPFALLSRDSVRQTSKRLNGRLGLARDFALGSPIGGLTASLGGELGLGWWTLEERESVVAEASWDFYRSADGPTALVGLTGELGGPVWRTSNLRWSIRSAVDYEMSDLTATARANYHYFSFDVPSESTVQNLDDQFTGRLGARLDYSRGPMGAFVSLERRRDLSLVSNVSGLGADGRASKRFLDGSSVAVWPVYSSRLTLGVNYGF